eukprot:403348285
MDFIRIGKKKAQKAPEILPFESSIVKNKKGKIVQIDFRFEEALKRIGKIEAKIDLSDKKLVKLVHFDGGYYEGEFSGKEFHGFGAYRLTNGDFYIGNFKRNMKHGLGLYKLGQNLEDTSQNGETFYKGYFKKDIKEGKGCMRLFNGDCYIGEFKDNTFEGKGKLMFHNGDYYEGEFKDGRFHDQGIYVYGMKQQYEGEFLNGKREGKGVLTSIIDDSKYIGEFIRDAKDGEGYQFIEDIEEYTGKFAENKKNGYGHLRDLKNDQIYEGNFTNDMKNGENGMLRLQHPKPFEIKGTFKQNQLLSGSTTLPDGSQYEGEFQELMPHGKGQMKYKNGNDYKGIFVFGVKQGYGRYFDKRDNSLYEGEFKNDMFNGKGKYTFSDGSHFTGIFIDNVLDAKLDEDV